MYAPISVIVGWRNKTNQFLCITRWTCHAKISNVCYSSQQPPDKLGDSRTCAMLRRHLCPLLLPRNLYSLPKSPVIYWGWWVTSILKRQAQGVKCDYRHFYRDSQHTRSFCWQGPHEPKAYQPFLWPDQYLAFGWVKKTMREICLEESSCWRKWWLELLLARRLSPQSCIPDTHARTHTQTKIYWPYYKHWRRILGRDAYLSTLDLSGRPVVMFQLVI
jgi:hypothetical protein